jgi:hypothetical protein
MKWALGLAAALSTVACGESTEEVGDTYQGTIDGSTLDSKFKPSSNAYSPVTAKVAGEPVAFYNLGVVPLEVKKSGKVTTAGVPVDASERPYLPASWVNTTSYDLVDGCQVGKADFDFRNDDYPENVQWPLFDKLPLSVSSTTRPPVALVKVKRWTGTGSTQCNAIKDDTSLTEGVFGGAAEEGESLALRAIIDVAGTVKPLREGSAFTSTGGWYKGLQLAWLDGGPVTVVTEEIAEGKTSDNVKLMDGVLVSGASGSSDPAQYLFSAKPGDADWSPLVRLRTFTAPGGKKPSEYTGLCTDECADTELRLTSANKFSGVLFIVGSTL